MAKIHFMKINVFLIKNSVFKKFQKSLENFNILKV